MARHLGSGVLLQRDARLPPVKTRVGVPYEVTISPRESAEHVADAVSFIQVDAEDVGNVPR